MSGVAIDIASLTSEQAASIEVAPRYVDPAVEMEAVRSYFTALLARRSMAFDLGYGADLPRRLRYDPILIRRCVGDMIANVAAVTLRGGLSLRAAAGRAAERLFRLTIEVAEETPAEAETEAMRAEEDEDVSALMPRLSRARLLARMLGGDVTAVHRPERGLLLTLTFLAEAVDAQPVSTSPAQAAQRRQLEGARVLIVDDIATNRRIARLLMEETGAKIDEAKDGSEALAMIGARSFDLILLDSHMPGLNGIETLKRLRAGPYASMPVIAFTAEAAPADRERLMSAGMDGFAAKPVDVDALINEASRLLAREGA